MEEIQNKITEQLINIIEKYNKLHTDYKILLDSESFKVNKKRMSFIICVSNSNRILGKIINITNDMDELLFSENESLYTKQEDIFNTIEKLFKYIEAQINTYTEIIIKVTNEMMNKTNEQLSNIIEKYDELFTDYKILSDNKIVIENKKNISLNESSGEYKEIKAYKNNEKNGDLTLK